jgi:hypothetical protein
MNFFSNSRWLLAALLVCGQYEFKIKMLASIKLHAASDRALIAILRIKRHINQLNNRN